MGLLSGLGPKLQGLFANPGFGDSLTQAQAFLNGDYGTGMAAAARRFRRGRGGSAIDALARGKGGMAEAGDGVAFDPPSDGADDVADIAPDSAVGTLANSTGANGIGANGTLANGVGANGTGGLAPAAAPPSAPAIGAVIYGHRFLGGDPQHKSSWEPFGGYAVGSGAGSPGDFGAWY
jgi:hypothetical protein